MNQNLEEFGTVTRESGNVRIEWPAGADLRGNQANAKLMPVLY